jgi:hypothetical protein
MTFADGTPDFEWSPVLADMVAWERHARQNRWPMTPDGATDFPRVTWTAFLCYAAMARLGKLTDKETFEHFITRCALPAPDAADTEAETEEGDPT